MSDNASAPAAAVESKEPVEETVTKPKTMGAHILIGLMIVVAILSTVSVCIVWFYRKVPGVTYLLFLWYYEVDTPVSSGGTQTTMQVDELGDETAGRLKTAAAFGISSIFSAVAAAFFAGFYQFSRWNGWTWFAALIATLAAFADALISWSVMLNLYLQQYFLSGSLKSLNWDIGAGWFLMLFSSLISLLALGFFLVNPAVPQTKEEIRRATALATFATSGTAFVLMVIGTPLSVFKYRSTTDTVNEISLWKIWINGTPTYTRDLDCWDLASMFKTCQVFSIFSCAFTCAAAATAVLRLMGKVSTTVSFAAGFLASVTTVIVVGVVTQIYYAQFCSSVQSLEQQLYVQTTSYAFFVSAFVLVFVGTGFQLLGGILNRKAESKLTIMNMVAVGGLFDALVLATVGVAVQFYEKFGMGDDSSYLISLWSYNFRNTVTFTHYDVDDYFCDTWARLAHAAAAFLIIGIAIMFVAFVLSLLTPANPRFRKTTGLVAIAAACSLAITIGITIALYHRKYCDNLGPLAQNGYDIAAGFGLTVAAFGLCFVGGIARLAIE